jgi:hypothetical protein
MKQFDNELTIARRFKIVWDGNATSIKELLLAANNAELMAKRIGKNRVYAAHSSETMQNL